MGKKTLIIIMSMLMILSSMAIAFAESDTLNSAPSDSANTEQIQNDKKDAEEHVKPEENIVTDDNSAEDPVEPDKSDTPEMTAPAPHTKKPLLNAAPPLKAAASISYTSNVVGGCRQFYSSDRTYVGTCCQPGVEGASSGTANMADCPELTRKLAYTYGYKLSWIYSHDVLDGFQELTNSQRFMYMK